MKKTITRGILLLILFTMNFNLFTFNVWGEVEDKEESSNNASLTVEAKSALLMEPFSGKIIFEKNINEKFAPASVTKIMTMLLAMEAIDSGKMKMTDTITVSENAKNMGGSTMLLDTGEIRSVEDILKGIAIASGNDAAVAMAEHLGGSEEGFVALMNERAKELGMENTNFKNCSGLPEEGHYSSAYDISLMSRELLKHKDILKYSGTYMETITEGRRTPIEMVNHNKLVRFFKGCDGLKTGFTDEAKYCISATATKDGIRMLAVIMGAPTFKERNRDASMLLNYGFTQYESKKLIEKDNDIEKVELNKKGDKFFMAKAKDDLDAVVERNFQGEVEQRVELDRSKTKYSEGEIVGKLDFYIDGTLIGSVDLYADRDARKPNLIDNIKSNISDLYKSAI